MQSADKIVVLDSKGIISQQGRFKELQSQPGYIQNLLLQEPTSLDATETIKEVLLPPVQSVGLKPRKTESLDMKRKTGDLSVYKYYFKSLGWRRTMIFILTEAICVILFKLPRTLIYPVTKSDS
jgi:ATP-binding cassette subfamily C (CFTR/MRP) protein 1